MATNKVPSEIVLRWKTGGGWTVARPEKARYEGRELKLPPYFKTDLASVPRLFRSIVPQVGNHLIPAVFHDCAYRGHFGMTRAFADRMFLAFMELSGVGWIRRRAMYVAVRSFGGLAWKGGDDHA